MNQLRRPAAGGRSTHTSGSGGPSAPAGDARMAAARTGGSESAATGLAAAGNASMSGGLGDGFLDWFNGVASAALGSDWLSSEMGATHVEEESAPALV